MAIYDNGKKVNPDDLKTVLTEGSTKTNIKNKKDNKTRPVSPPPMPNVLPPKKLEVPSLGVYKIEKDVKDLGKSTHNSSCYDLRAYIPLGSSVKVWNLNNRVRKVYSKMSSNNDEACIVLEPQDRALIPTGIHIDIPLEHSFRIHPRSGLSLTQGLKLNNSEGIIDNDYVEQVYMSLFNASGARIYIEHQDRVAQGELVKDIKNTVRKLRKKPKQKTNRTGGIGHTGTK